MIDCCLQTNSGFKPKEGEVTSQPWQWPINFRVINKLTWRTLLVGASNSILRCHCISTVQFIFMAYLFLFCPSLPPVSEHMSPHHQFGQNKICYLHPEKCLVNLKYLKILHVIGHWVSCWSLIFMRNLIWLEIQWSVKILW